MAKDNKVILQSAKCSLASYVCSSSQKTREGASFGDFTDHLSCPNISRQVWLETRSLEGYFILDCYRFDARKYFFSSRVITIWNQLPAEVLNALTVAAFVAKLRSCDLSRYLL